MKQIDSYIDSKEFSSGAQPLNIKESGVTNKLERIHEEMDSVEKYKTGKIKVTFNDLKLLSKSNNMFDSLSKKF